MIIIIIIAIHVLTYGKLCAVVVNLHMLFVLNLFTLDANQMRMTHDHTHTHTNSNEKKKREKTAQTKTSHHR